MTKKRNLALIAVAVVAIALLAGNGTAVRALFGPRAMLDISGQQGQHAAIGQAVGGTTPVGQVVPGTGPAPAAAKATASVTVARDASGDRGYLIQARVMTIEGKPVGSAVVRFYDVVQLLGPREMLIGARPTDGQGTASLSYTPAQGGTHQIVARAASSQLGVTTGSASFDATVVAPSTYARERLPLDPFSANLPFAGETVLLVVWGLFAFVVVGSLIRIPRGARNRSPLARQAREI